MKVTDIDILDLHFDAAAKRHAAYVSMELCPALPGAMPVRVQYLCHCGRAERAPATLVVYDLIRDALRQARRMPGFRRGEHVIEVEVSAARIEGLTASA
jgi:hypothetical protein